MAMKGLSLWRHWEMWRVQKKRNVKSKMKNHSSYALFGPWENLIEIAYKRDSWLILYANSIWTQCCSGCVYCMFVSIQTRFEYINLICITKMNCIIIAKRMSRIYQTMEVSITCQTLKKSNMSIDYTLQNTLHSRPISNNKNCFILKKVS